MPVSIKKTAGTPSNPFPMKKRGGGVLDRIKPMEIQETGLKCLVYGASGTGKTTFWASFPGPILAILCSGGRTTGELRSVNTPEYRKKIRQVIIEKTDEVAEVIDYAPSGGFATVVLDHVSGLQDQRLAEILGLPEIPQVKNWGMARQQDYGKCATDTIEILRRLLSFPGNVVIVGQERTFGGKDDGVDDGTIKPTVGAAVMPSIVRWLNPAVDYVLQTYKRPKMKRTEKTIGGKTIVSETRDKGVEFCLRTEPHDVYATKFRRPKDSGELPECIVDADYGKLIDLIGGN